MSDRRPPLRSCSIQFTDYIMRLLTGGAMFGASLAYDALCGDVPPVDSPLLGFLSMMQLTWYASQITSCR